MKLVFVINFLCFSNSLTFVLTKVSKTHDFNIADKQNCILPILETVVDGLKTSSDSKDEVTEQGMVPDIKNQLNNFPRNCFDLLNLSINTSGVQTIYPFQYSPQWGINVFCDQTIDEGGWTVFQARDADFRRENFFRTFTEYSLGFGDLRGEFWLGLNNIRALTSSTLMELRIDLMDNIGEKRFAKYGYFAVGSSAEKYILSVGGYSGDAGDGLTTQDQMKFSTRDQDNDIYNKNCASIYKGGWWYAKCHSSNLNGFQYVGNHTSPADGINWKLFRGQFNSMVKVRMMIRPAYRNNF